MNIEINSRVARLANAQATNVDKDVVILNMKTGKYVALDAIGRRIWELMEKPRTVSEICIILNGEFSAPEGAIEKDVLAFITRLEGDGLANVVEG